MGVGFRENYSPSGSSPNGSPRRTRGSQFSKESMEGRDDIEVDYTSSEEEYELNIEDLLADSMSPGLRL